MVALLPFFGAPRRRPVAAGGSSARRTMALNEMASPMASLGFLLIRCLLTAVAYDKKYVNQL